MVCLSALTLMIGWRKGMWPTKISHQSYLQWLFFDRPSGDPAKPEWSPDRYSPVKQKQTYSRSGSLFGLEIHMLYALQRLVIWVVDATFGKELLWSFCSRCTCNATTIRHSSGINAQLHISLCVICLLYVWGFVQT